VLKPSICVLPELKGFGGPSSFQAKLKKGLENSGIAVHHDIHDASTRALLVIGGTRRLHDLFYAKHQGIRIIQRLDGMNWLHKKKKTGIRHYLRSERMNLQLSFIRRFFADAVVYQSKFTRDWWHTVYGSLRTPHTVIYNAVDLSEFSPGGVSYQRDDEIRILVVEGSFKGGHERDLQNALQAANQIAEEANSTVRLLIAGKVPITFKDDLQTNPAVTIEWLGMVPHNDIPELDRSAHLFFPAEINAACPNALIEALACGLPVVGYATGSLPELVGEDGGIIVPYDGDFWNLEAPKSEPLAKAACEILNNHQKFQHAARERAENLFSVEQMVEDYRKMLLDPLPGS
jgi:glycosyltransferase involved in cell wall biosynthesis